MPRRAPAPEERRRDAERTRQALLDAGVAEFADKGRAGARVSEIARRAGVNPQLISYYFGGKDGLYQAILERWWADEREFDAPDIDLGEYVTRYLRHAHNDPNLMRMFLRETFDQDVSEVAHEPDADDLDGLRRRQAAGEIADELDPAFVLLVLQSAVVSGMVFPGDVKRIMGLDPASPEFLEHMDRQLRLLAKRLGD